MIAAHLSTCSECREKLAFLEDIGGCQLELVVPQNMAPNALDVVLTQLGDQEEKPSQTGSGQSATAETNNSIIPYPLRSYLPKHLADVAWKFTAPGIKTYALPETYSGSGALRLIKIAPGMTIPKHTHGGMELTLVLQGSFSDEVGRSTLGDIADLDEETLHQPIADTDEDCICLITTDAPLRFNKLVPKLVQYFTGV
jgi:putative transcriptional regulator